MREACIHCLLMLTVLARPVSQSRILVPCPGRASIQEDVSRRRVMSVKRLELLCRFIRTLERDDTLSLSDYQVAGTPSESILITHRLFYVFKRGLLKEHTIIPPPYTSPAQEIFQRETRTYTRIDAQFPHCTCLMHSCDRLCIRWLLGRAFRPPFIHSHRAYLVWGLAV
jgi:hypothetical protein